MAAVDALGGQGLSLRRGIGVCGACCLGAGWCWFQDCACLVNRDSVGGGQGGPGRQVMVAAQQQVNRMRPLGGGRDEYRDHRPGRAATAAIGKARRPGPGGLVDGCPWIGLGFARQELHRRSAGAGSRLRPASPPPPPRAADGWAAVGLAHRVAAWRVYSLRPGVLPDVLDVSSDARRAGVGPADPLQRARDLTVVQAGIITAVAADDLELVGVAAFRPALHDAGRRRRSTTVQPSPGWPWSFMSGSMCDWLDFRLPGDAQEGRLSGAVVDGGGRAVRMAPPLAACASCSRRPGSRGCRRRTAPTRRRCPWR